MKKLCIFFFIIFANAYYHYGFSACKISDKLNKIQYCSTSDKNSNSTLKNEFNSKIPYNYKHDLDNIDSLSFPEDGLSEDSPGFYYNFDPIKDEELINLYSYPNLNELLIRSPKITDKGLIYLENLPSLKNLVLIGTKITSRGLKSIAKIKNLQSLALINNNIKLDSLKYVKHVKSIIIYNYPKNALLNNIFVENKEKITSEKGRIIDLSDNYSNIHWFSEITTYPKTELKNIKIVGEYEDCEFQSLVGFDDLEYLELNDTKISNAGLVNINSFNSLKELVIKSEIITDKGLDFNKTHHLEKINLKFKSKIFSLKHLIDNNPKLNTIIINNLVDRNIILELHNLKHIYNLQLFNCGEMSDDDLKSISKINDIRFLKLCSLKISSKAYNYLSNLTNLNKLMLTSNITDLGLGFIKHLTSLNFLALHDTNISDDGIKILSNNNTINTLIVHSDKIIGSSLKFFKGNKSIKVIKLKSDKLDSLICINCSKELNNLETLELAYLEENTYDQIKSFLPNCNVISRESNRILKTDSLMSYHWFYESSLSEYYDW